MNLVLSDARAGLVPAPAALAEKARAWAAPLVTAAGDSFRALYVYGSALTPEFDAQKSDVNVLVVVKDLGFGRLDAVAKALAGAAKSDSAGKHTPLVLTESQLRDSADVFPMDLLDLGRSRALLQGDDVLATLSISRADLRRHCEYELRTKLVGLRQAYLRAGGDAKAAHALTAQAGGGANALYRHLLALAGRDDTPNPEARARAVGQAFAVDGEALAAPFVARGQASAPADDAAKKRFADFVDALDALVRAVNALDAN